MVDFLEIFLQNILPIMLVAGMGYALRRLMRVSKDALSKASLYVLSPALIFTSLIRIELDGDELLNLAVFAVAMTLIMALIALVVARVIRLSKVDSVAFILVVTFVNGGNYGLTLNQLRYGEPGLARAVIFFVVGTILVYTVGIFVASMGQSSWQDSLIGLFKQPAFYAVILAMIIYNWDITVPGPIMSTLDITAAGAIPVLLLVLGMQLADLRQIEQLWLALPATFLRLVVAAVVALVVARLLGLSGLARSTSIIEASMPTAVITTIMATEFDVRPGLVTTTVVLSTLLSALSLPLIISLFGL